MEQKIGTYFKKENIFLGTLVRTATTSDEVREAFIASGIQMKGVEAEGIATETVFKIIAVSRAIEVQEPDIFYKDENGSYTRFFVEGKETVVGDNSDGKGILTKIIPVWDYYSEDELWETVNDMGENVIVDGAEDLDLLEKYNIDYNKSKK